MKQFSLSLKMFQQMVKQISREAMLQLLVAAPILAGLLFKFGIPAFEKGILSRFGLEEILVPYYSYFNWLLALLTGMLFAFVGGLVVLGEIDDGVSKYICITPVGSNGYLFSRIFIPAILSGIFASIVITIFSLVPIAAETLVIMIISTMLSGIITSLLVIAISSNKVEGMAIGKLSGGFGMVMFIPLFVKGSIQYVFSVFPMFWVGKYIQNGTYTSLIFALILFIGWIVWLMKRFRRKI